MRSLDRTISLASSSLTEAASDPLPSKPCVVYSPGGVEMESKDKKKVGQGTGLGIGLGVIFGVVIGLLTDDLGLWIAIGVAIGAGSGTAIGAAQSAKKKKEDSP